MSRRVNKILTDIYFNTKHPASFSTADTLWKATAKTIPKIKVQKWIEGQEAYTLHRPIRKRFPRNRYYVDNIDVVWQADLNDMRSLQAENDGYNYLLTIIDVFSKHAWALPLKTKTGPEVTKAFQDIFQQSKRKPLKIQTDLGGEFVNKVFKTFLEKHNITLYHIYNPDTKACIVERFNRTLKARMWRYFTHEASHRYLEVLPDLLHAYNHSKHRSIGMSPSEVNDTNVLTVWHSLYGNKSRNPVNSLKMKFKIGDKVRISKEKMAFEKGYEENWSTEVFIITQCKNRKPFVYVLEDLAGEPITGTFYEHELQRVQITDTSTFKIDKILQTLGRGARKKVLVSWKGYPSKFNEWILASTLKQKK